MTMPQATAAAAPATLLGSEQALCAAYDVALLDLDGVCFAGEARVPHAADNVNAARRAGMHLSFVTNNASRAPQTVVDKLVANGITAEASEVFSAAMDAARHAHRAHRARLHGARRRWRRRPPGPPRRGLPGDQQRAGRTGRRRPGLGPGG